MYITDARLGVEQDVLRLQVAVDDVVSMQVGDRQNYLSRVEPRLLRSKLASLRQVEEQFAAWTVLQKQIQLFGSLKGSDAIDNKGMFDSN